MSQALKKINGCSWGCCDANPRHVRRSSSMSSRRIAYSKMPWLFSWTTPCPEKWTIPVGTCANQALHRCQLSWDAAIARNEFQRLDFARLVGEKECPGILRGNHSEFV